MATQNSINLKVTNNADGFDVTGGTTSARKLKVSGADVEIAGGGTATVTFPSSTTTLVGRDTSDTLTNKVIDAATISTSLVPTSNDGAALGNTTNMFSDLFLASGSVINFNNGDVTITHSADQIAIAGGTLRTNDIQLTTGSAIRTGSSAGNTVLFQARDVDGASFTTFATLTANNTPTFDLSTAVTIGGAAIYAAGGTDVALADGGTGASLTDPGANTIMGWDDTDNAVVFITIGSGLTYTHATHTLSSSGGGGATTALDNLASVAINTSLLPGTNDGAALGSATLSFSDLFLASGSVINFNNGDVTITHSTDAITIAGGTLQTNDISPSTGSAIRTRSSAGNTVLFQARDVDGASFTTFATLTANNTPTMDLSTAVTIGGDTIVSLTGSQTLTNKTLTSPVLNTPTVGTSLLPTSSDGAALGSSTVMWSDLFLASGAVINFNNGDVTLTHSADTLTLAGGTLALGSNDLTMTGSLGATGARLTKVWTAALESTAAPTVGGSAVYYTGGTDVAVADGGTGGSTAAAARTNLGHTFTLTFSCQSSTPLASQTYYFGVPYDFSMVNTTAQRRQRKVNLAAVLKGACITVIATAGGSTEQMSVYARINNTTDVTLSTAVQGDQVLQAYNITGLSQSISAGDLIEIKVVTPAWVTAPTTVRMVVDLYFE